MRRNLELLCLSLTAICLITAKPVVKKMPDPDRTDWKPAGCRYVPSDHPALGAPTPAFRTLHADVVNSDEVAIAVGPVLEVAWTAETHTFSPEGPTFDRDGNLYFSPLFTMEHVILISLDPETGKRRWAIEGFPLAGGAPLILSDPDNPEEEIIYVASAERVIAVHPDGSFVWDVPIGPFTVEHCFGLNYLPQHDALVGAFETGQIFVLDRKTGKELMEEPYVMPGAPSASAKTPWIPKFVYKRLARELAGIIGEHERVEEYYPLFLQVVLGGEHNITNYYSIDPHTGMIWLASTAPDDEDGKVDGLSEYGAIYALELFKEGTHYQLREVFHFFFKGGTTGTPALTADGKRVYVSDSFGNLIAIDSSKGEKIWELDVGEQIVASIHVSSDNRELYAPTPSHVIKVKDMGEKGKIIWRSKMDMYKPKLGMRPTNIMAAGIAANGVTANVGASYRVFGINLPVTVGIGVLDRETGELRSFAEGIEESVSVMAVGPQGDIYLAHSPLRRAFSRALFGNATYPLVGGVTKYKVSRYDLLARDSVCAAAYRIENAANVRDQCSGSYDADIKQIKYLMDQTVFALGKAAAEKQLDQSLAEGFIDEINKAGRPDENQEQVSSLLHRICDSLP